MKTCCIALSQCYEHTGKGLRALILINRKTCKERIVDCLFSGEHRKRGILINYCPFCGKRVKQAVQPKQP